MEQTDYNKQKIIVHPATLDILATATWNFAHAVLWRKSHFEEDEVPLFKSLIREYYKDVPAENFQEAAMNRFDGYCDRIMAARVNNWNETTHPLFWFNKMNRNGFMKTAEEHKSERSAQRKSNKEYFEELFCNDPLYEKIINNRYIKFLHYANRNY